MVAFLASILKFSQNIPTFLEDKSRARIVCAQKKKKKTPFGINILFTWLMIDN